MNTIEQLEVSGSHREVGRNIGHHFADAIHRLFDNYDFFELNDQKQKITLSSRKRLERSMTLCRATFPINSGHVLALLSDQTDRDYPIYRDATPPDDDATLCSALFDLDNRQLRIYWDNPVKGPEKCMQFAM